MAEVRTRRGKNTASYTLADGTKKVYQTTQKYKIEGYVHDDGKVYKFSPEQIAEMQRRYNDGVSKKRLAEDYKCGYSTVVKYLNFGN